MVKINTCVFISGKGSNLKKLILNSNNYNFPIKIKLVVSNNKNAEGLKFAKKWSIPYLIINYRQNLSEDKLLVKLKHYKVNLILLAGYMKILSKNFIRSFGKSIINIHPSLLPKFKGLNTFEKVLIKKEKKTGCTVHFVDTGIDTGNHLIQAKIKIRKNETAWQLGGRIHEVEKVVFWSAITMVLEGLVD